MLTFCKAEIANNYLKISAFSRDGLIRQLEFDGFTHEDAVMAADSSMADWNEQALRAAESYRSLLKLPPEELVAALISDGFTQEQASFGAKGRF